MFYLKLKKHVLVVVVLCAAALLALLLTPQVENAHDAQPEAAPSPASFPAQAASREAVIEASDSSAIVAANTAAGGEAASPLRVTPQRLTEYFSPTLEGTDIDGHIRLGNDGRIVLELQVKDFIDYFLSASDEVTPEVAIAEMLKVVEASLGEDASAQVMQILDSYLSYKEQAMALMAQPMLPRAQQTPEYQLQAMESTLLELRSLRRATMSPQAVEAFFGLEEAYEDYSLASMKVQLDESLAPQQKAQMISYYRSQLPDVIRHTEERIAEDSQRSEAIFKAMQASDEAELRAQLDRHDYSAEQKQEIIDFYRAQQDFDKRYAAYAAQLATIDTQKNREEIKERLLRQYFQSEEEITQARVRDLSG